MKVTDKISNLDSLKENPQFSLVIQGLLSDEIQEDLLLDYLESVTLHSMYVKGELIGFYSIEEELDFVEAHAYVFPSSRRYSLMALRHIINSQDKDIKTSVHGTHPHVKDFLMKLGFELTHTHTDALHKQGVSYDVWDLLLRRK